jgi:hypothetical protein
MTLRRPSAAPVTHPDPPRPLVVCMCGRVCVLAYDAMLFLVSRYVMCAAMCGPAPEDGGGSG